MKILKCILFIIIFLNGSISTTYSAEPFYYRDTNGNIRINENCPKDEFGNIQISEDLMLEQLKKDSSLSAIEKLNLIDSIYSPTSNYISRNEQLSDTLDDYRSSKDLTNRIIIITTSVIVAAIYIYIRKIKK